MLDNRERLKEIIKKKFAIDDYDLINEYIDNPPMGKKLKKLFENSDDLRLYFEIEKDGSDSKEFILFLRFLETLYYQFDIKNKSKEFHYIYNNVAYKDFENNKILFLKNEIKIFKTILSAMKKNVSKNIEVNSVLLKFYKDNFFEEYLKSCDIEDNIKLVEKIIEGISIYKTSNKNRRYLVISRNPIDFLLCATSENWSSCLNMESTYAGMAWAHLPGWFGDKSRVIVYITDDIIKRYEGLETKRFIARSWAIYDGDAFHIIRWFPQSLLTIKELNKTVSENPNIKFLNKKIFISEYEIEPITFHNLILSPYLDNLKKIIVCNKIFYSVAENFSSEGMKIFNKDLSLFTEYNIWHSLYVDDIENVEEAFVGISNLVLSPIDKSLDFTYYNEDINESNVVYSDIGEKENYTKYLTLEEHGFIQGILINENSISGELVLKSQCVIEKG